MESSRTPAERKRQSGVSLIEVMVALVIMSIGVLGLAGLQLVTKRNTLDAAQRAVAAELASDLLERIRHNASTNALYVYTNNGVGLTLGGGSLSGTTVVDCRNASTPCAPADLASNDLKDWEAQLDGAAESSGGGLINGRACISQVVATGGGTRIEVVIVWRGSVELPDNTAVTCENATSPALYTGTTTNDLRRTFSLETYVTDRGALS